MSNIVKKKRLSAYKFRQIQDNILGLDDYDMARLIGLKMDKPANAKRVIEKMRTGKGEISRIVQNYLWMILEYKDAPDWIRPEILDRVRS